MNPTLRLLAVLAAPMLPATTARADGFTVPVIRLSEPPRMTNPGTPVVFFAIPKYTLTNTERETVAACLVLEAANQGDFGMRSVMAVIRNRAHGRAELFAPTVLREKQFSALNKHTAGREPLARVVARARQDPMWFTALALVDEAVQEAWHDPTDGATHYTRTGERTRWTSNLAKTVTIGAHSFYR